MEREFLFTTKAYKVAVRIIDKKLLFDGKTIRKEKNTVKEKNEADGNGTKGAF